MRYALQPWEQLVFSTASPEQLSTLTAPALQDLTAQSARFGDSLRQRFMQDFYSSAHRLHIYIPFNQTVLVQLLDTLAGYIRDSSAPDAIDFYTGISRHIGSVLQFLELFFEDQFDGNARVPRLYREQCLEQLQKRLSELGALLQECPGLQPGLRDLLLQQFHSFCRQPAPDYTFRTLLYHKRLLAELLESMRLSDPVAQSTRVTDVLLYMNFNHPAFAEGYLAAVSEGLQARKSTAAKLSHLDRTRSSLQAQPEKTGMALYPAAPSVRHHLILALEAATSLIRSAPSRPTPPTAEMIQVPFKGAEIYLLHKAFIDSGGAPQEIYKTLLEKTAAHLGNKTQKGFSAESLVKYSDKVDPESRDAVKRFLQKMIRNVDSYD